MLLNTFCHLPGIGLKTEASLWARSIRTWDDFLCAQSGHSTASRALLTGRIRASAERLAESDPAYFEPLLPASERWRMYPHFSGSTAFVDIETNGLMGPGSYITTIALYDGRSVYTFVRGRNLNEFPEHISRYNVLVTYNGKCFDVPFIESAFGIRLPHAHIDLRYVMHSLGLKGGLKGVERQLGMDREELDGVDGYFAVLLWNDFLKTGDEAVLDTLLAYNVKDTVNLAPLMVAAYNLKLEATPFAGELTLSEHAAPEPLFRADRGVIDRVYRVAYGTLPGSYSYGARG